jgi:TAG lipase/steryl ester hydrolase/phospholipase A2/LPA acyltransferase
MVLLDYLQKPPSLCVDEGISQRQLPSSTPVQGYLCDNEEPTTTRESVSHRPWGLLSPATRILRGSVSLVNLRIAGYRDGLTEDERAAARKKEEMRQILALRMKNAEIMEKWQNAAKELDLLEDNESWKHDSTSSEFDAELIEARLKQLDDARINCDIKAMMNLVRTALSRNLGDMGSIRLYKHSHIGTKDLIERYIDSTLDTIRAMVDMSKRTLPDGLETKDILEQVVYARQSFGRSALLLSGGATFGMSHVGVLKALHEAKLLPRIISGASAGSIVCAVLCTRIDEEIPAVLEMFPHGDLAVFEEDGREDGILERVRRLLTQGSWIDIKHLTRVMNDLLGDMTFQEAYNRTRRILNICVSSASVYELPRLLNYVTAPNVMIWSAVAASCSVPLLFSAAQLLVKNPATGEHTPWNPTPQHWIDGSVDNDLPMTRLAEMFNVNHFIVSQVNPHVVPFLVKDDEAITKDAQSDSQGPGWVYTLTNLAKDEVLHRMHVLAEIGVFPNLVTKARSVLSQKYSGDITILPQIDYKDFPRMLKNPTTEFMLQSCLSGERATWPKLSMIRNHCAVEIELDSAVQKLRDRVVFSPSQVDLRRMTTGSYQDTSSRRGRRRDSGGDLSGGLETLSKTSNANDKSKKALSRPGLKGSSSHWNIPRRYQQPLVPLGSRSTHATPLQTPQIREIDPFNLTKPLKIPDPNVPDLSSATETAYSPPSSDADIDSLTDDSSPGGLEDPNSTNSRTLANYRNAKSQSSGISDEIDFFSNSQPVTAKTDHVMATSPLSTRSNMGLMSPSAMVERMKGQDGSIKENSVF